MHSAQMRGNVTQSWGSGAGCVALREECLPTTYNALASVPSTIKRSASEFNTSTCITL